MKNKNAMFYARQVIKYCHENNFNITNTVLNHTLYVMQSLNYILERKPLFEDEFLAFKKGPLIYKVFCNFSSFANACINIDTEKIKTELNDTQKKLINLIFNHEPEFLLNNITQKNGAWDTTITQKFGIGQIIQKQLIELDAQEIFKKNKYDN